MVKDIETIKNITVKDFDHFQNHVGFVDEESDPLFGRNLFSLKGTVKKFTKWNSSNFNRKNDQISTFF